MKILHICTMDYCGAGTAALRLHLGLKSIGAQSKMLVENRKSQDDDVVELEKSNPNIFKKIENRVRRKILTLEESAYNHIKPAGQDLFSNNKTLYKIGEHPLVKEADIINLHWIAWMIDYNEFFPKVRNKPMVWTLHDSNPFTGGCHVPGDCVKYQTGCGRCPQLGSESQNDLSRKIFKQKQELYKGNDIHIVAASKGYANRIRRSQLFKDYKHGVIPLGIPHTVFTPHDKKYSRNLFNLPHDKTLILLANDRPTESKGLKYLVEALKRLKNRVDLSKFGLVYFGYCKRDLKAEFKDVGCSFHQLGYIHDQALLSSVYSSCDIFVNPSLDESFGLTSFESMASGTPVVSFKTGGMSDIATPHRTNLIAELKNTQGLADKIEYMITHPKERQEMGENARKLVEQEYTLQIQAKRYLKLYETMLKR